MLLLPGAGKTRHIDSPNTDPLIPCPKPAIKLDLGRSDSIRTDEGKSLVCCLLPMLAKSTPCRGRNGECNGEDKGKTV